MLALQASRGTKSTPTHSYSPSPIICACIPLNAGQEAEDYNSTHSMLVDNIVIALQGDPSDNEIVNDDGSPTGSEEKMSEDEEPDDMMTLV